MSTEQVLIVGGAGFLGASLSQALLHAGNGVTVLDAFRPAASPRTSDYTAATRYRAAQLEGATVIRGDACDPMDMLRAFDTAKPSHVVHLAALAYAPLNESHVAQAIHESTASLVNTIQLAARFGVQRIVLASSSYVYGDFQYLPCDEGHPLRPRTTYGAAKLAAEAVMQGVGASLGVEWAIARLIAVYGPWDLNGKLSAQNLLEAARTGNLPIAGTDGATGTDYTHVSDAVSGLRLLLTHPAAAGAVFNIARGRARAASDVANVLTGLGHPCTPAPERVAGRPKRGALAIDHAANKLGFRPVIDLEDGLAECVATASSLR